MKKTRQPIPAGLAEMPPGPELAAVLAAIDPRRLGGLDCVTVMRAQHRQASHEQARLMAAMVEVALCGIGPDDELPRMDAPDEFSADEIRGALAWTRSAAGNQLSLAWDLVDRLPEVFAAIDAGAIDAPKARVFSEWTTGLTDRQARHICAQLLPEAPTLTTGQLAERVKRLAIAIDPEWVLRRYAEAVRGRKVVGYRNDDGTANLCGYQLPTDRVAAACAHIGELAQKVKRAGDTRPLDHIKADLYVGMLDGTYAGRTDADIIVHMLAAAEEHVTAPGPHSHPNGRPTGDPAGEPRPHGHRDGTPDRAATETPSTSARRAGVEIRAELTTLLGFDRHPGEIAGWGFVDAEATRRLVREQTAAEWRFAITDEAGRLLHEGITRCRPHGYPPRAASPCRGGVVELHVKLLDLYRLAARSGDWATVIADLARQADRFERGHPQVSHQPPARQAGRSPGRPLRRSTEIRDRTCVHPQCRAPAHGTDGDHTHDWANGGATRDGNIGSLCRHDHRLKHEGGWTLTQPRPGHFEWSSRLGRHYHVDPPLIIQSFPDPIPRDPPPPF
ncbi:MAG TPA: DUF222 domain-containing protein [Streptosporangiaceae bacterium]|nr:DUF222 domain-containing protein [Streptosporangiaceae bacterium]